ncbi:hypothetical protein C0J52_05552 [Blattella germanica]|nr:hypothetical protein C0J52_05552 [Blattella germanica]
MLRAERERDSKRVLEYKDEGRKRVGRPKLRWEDCVIKNIQKLGVNKRWIVAKDRFGGQIVDTIK